MNLLPNKHVTVDGSLLAVGYKVLSILWQPLSFSEVWNAYRDTYRMANFERVVFALDVLYALGLVEVVDHTISRAEQ